MTSRRRIAVLTTGRQDFGIVRSTCHAIVAHPSLELVLIVAGMHLEEEFGFSVAEIERDGLPIAARLRTAASGSPVSDAAAMLQQLPGVLAAEKVAALLLVGDRSETLAAAMAATLARTPIVHVHGGEETEGAIDNAFRHALTKLSHLHLVSHEEHARRVRQMGEPTSAVHVVGVPGHDNLLRSDIPSRAQLESRLGIELVPPVVLMTYHPTTLGGVPEAEIGELIAAMGSVAATYVITLPNNDDGADPIRAALVDFAHHDRARRVAVDQLGAAAFAAMMRNSDAMLGNSSSALIEAPLFALPAVNVGDRQRGRRREANVIDVACERDAIIAGLRRALLPATRKMLTVPSADGRTGERIAAILADWACPAPPRKSFVDR